MIVGMRRVWLSVALALLSIWFLNLVTAQEQSQLPADEYTERGIACLRIDDFDGAIANFDKAIALNPNDAVSYLRRGGTYMERGVERRDKADLSRAIADLDKAIALDPHNAAYYFTRGSVRLYQWKDREAGEDFRKSLELDSKQKPEMDRVISVIKKKRKAARMR
jgi:tetratricopeptide (TPR) repeat protein